MCRSCLGAAASNCARKGQSLDVGSGQSFRARSATRLDSLLRGFCSPRKRATGRRSSRVGELPLRALDSPRSWLKNTPRIARRKRQLVALAPSTSNQLAAFEGILISCSSCEHFFLLFDEKKLHHPNGCRPTATFMAATAAVCIANCTNI